MTECSGGLDYITWFWMGFTAATCVGLAVWTVWRNRGK